MAYTGDNSFVKELLSRPHAIQPRKKKDEETVVVPEKHSNSIESKMKKMRDAPKKPKNEDIKMLVSDDPSRKDVMLYFINRITGILSDD